MRADSISPQASWPSDDHDAHARGRADGTQRQRCVRRREVRPGRPRRRRSRRRGAPAAGRSASPGWTMSISGRAPVDLHHARVLHGARDGDERGPGILDQAVGPERVGAGPGDHGDVRQRLGVVHQRALAADAQGRPLVGTERRQRPARLDPARQAPTPPRPRSDRAAGPAPRGRARSPPSARSAIAVETAAATCSRPSGTHTDDLPRTARRRPSAGRRRAPGAATWMSSSLSLSLAGSPSMRVDDDGAAAAGGVRHGQLDGGGEPGPAAAGQAGGLEHRHEGLAPAAWRLATGAGRGRASPRARPDRWGGREAGSDPSSGRVSLTLGTA